MSGENKVIVLRGKDVRIDLREAAQAFMDIRNRSMTSNHRGGFNPCTNPTGFVQPWRCED